MRLCVNSDDGLHSCNFATVSAVLLWAFDDDFKFIDCSRALSFNKKFSILSLSKASVNSDTEFPKSHADNYSTFLTNLANFGDSDGLTRFLRN